MTIQLHAKAKSAMVEALRSGLPHIKVKNGKWLETFTAFLAAWKANEALPSNGKLHEQLVDYVDELPFVDFVIETLRRDLDDRFEHDRDNAELALVDMDGYKDHLAVAAGLVEAFETLPWRYSMAMRLPERLFPEDLFQEKSLSLGDRSFLILPDMLFKQQFPLSNPNPRIERRAKGPGILAIFGNNAPDWEAGSAYFVNQDAGFVGVYGGGSMMDRAERKLESFLGLGLATRLFSYNRQYENPEVKLHWFVHKEVQEGWAFDSRIEISDDVAEVLRHTVSFRFADIYPVEQRIPWLQGVLEKADKVLRSERSGTLQLATKWFFDSFKGMDQTLRYIRLMTTIEILVGEHADTSKASLGELLGNRLAYLIGKNHKDRADILQEFKTIYGVRSGILHHGKHKLSASEKGYISKLRSYCERAIEEEVRLILA